MLAGKQSFLKNMIVSQHARAMSSASIQSRFQAAYDERIENIKKNPVKR